MITIQLWLWSEPLQTRIVGPVCLGEADPAPLWSTPQFESTKRPRAASVSNVVMRWLSASSDPELVDRDKHAVGQAPCPAGIRAITEG